MKEYKTMQNLSLDDDVEIEVRSLVTSKPIHKPDDVFLPIPELGYNMKKLEDTTDSEFMSWLKSVMPFTEEMINVFLTQQTTKKASIDTKKFLFETACVLHERRWLFGKEKLIIKQDLRQN